MVWFPGSLIFVAVAATVALATPAPTNFAPIIDRQSADPTSTIFQQTLSGSTTINANVAFLLVNDSLVGETARGVQQFILFELILLTSIQDDLANAGEHGVDQDIADIRDVDNDALKSLLTIVTLLSADSAHQCAMAVACSRNNIVGKFNKVLNKYDDIVGNFRRPPADIQTIQIPGGFAACNTPRNFCPK
ncbi:hypothetical protein K449DRAFT_401139 [Hypoxylon sp. EC38]|nr:hypothetical protein K449DRAFT_401139 [Hypoxylon sp. EC38]